VYDRKKDTQSRLSDPDCWGLPIEAVDELPDRLQQFCQRYRSCFHTQTHDSSEYAHHYLSGLLRMKGERNFAEIGRTTGQAGENIQHFMSNSPWLAQAVYKQVQEEIATTPALQEGGALVLDESADAKAGPCSAGAARQRNGRLGKVDLCQVGVFLAFVKGHTWTWVDGELFLPESWFTAEWKVLRQKAGIPEKHAFRTKVELGWQMIKRVQQNGLPFKFVACDDLYGRAKWFRAKLDQTEIVYMADVPRNTHVYLTRPVWGVPSRTSRSGRRPKQARVLSPEKAMPAWRVVEDPQTHWRTLRVRPIERGQLIAPYAARRVWTLRDGRPTAEWLLMRREEDGEVKYALSNAPPDTPLEHLAWMESQRYFVERSIQDAKSELGWDEFQARKLRAWEHQTALTAMAAWFVAQTKLAWAQCYPRETSLAAELGVDVLPELSVANVRQLLRAAMPLPHLSKHAARELIVTHLLNRTHSRRSRLRKQESETRHLARDPT
jgi:SRSO17 transposase